MQLLYFSTALVCAILPKAAKAAAIPQIDDGLGAQLTDDSNTGFSSAIPIATTTQGPTVRTNLTRLKNHEQISPVQFIYSQPAKSNSSIFIPTRTRNMQPIPSATAPIAQDNSLEAQSPDAINQVFDSFTNITSTSIPITANSTSPPPPIQDNGLLSQDTNPKDAAFISGDNSTINIDPQPVNESITKPSGQENDVPQQQSQAPPDNGLLAQLSTTENISSPTSLPILKPNTTTKATPISTPLPPPPSSTASSPTHSAPAFIPQDNGLQAQDVSGENDDFTPQTNQTSVNYPHEFHDSNGELLVPVVQDDGLQAQDSGGANVDWSVGEVYDGGVGGDINVPTVVNDGVVDQTK